MNLTKTLIIGIAGIGLIALFLFMMGEQGVVPGNDDTVLPDTVGVTEIDWDGSEVRDQTGATLFSADDIPSNMRVSENAEFGVAGPIQGALLSPDNETIAVTTGGVAHDGGWLYDIETQAFSPAVFQYGGGVWAIAWDPSASHIIFKVSTPAETTLLRVVSRDAQEEYVADRGFTISVPEEDEPPFTYTFSQWRDENSVCGAFNDMEWCVDIRSQEVVE